MVNIAIVIFKKRVLWQKKTLEKNIDLKIQSAVLKQLGPGVFTQFANHFFQNIFGQNVIT